MSELLIVPHLGLGDGLIGNSIFRHYAAKHDSVVVLCKPHNQATLAFMVRDVINIEMFSVKNDDEARECIKDATRSGFEVLKMGVFRDEPFDVKQWDREFYRQAGIEFQRRWNDFTVPRQPSRELPIPSHPYILVHEDKPRGFLIDRKRLPDLPVVEVVPTGAGNLFDYWNLMENATELHFMESAPAILVDSLPLVKARRRVIHHYCRNSVAPHYQTEWEHLT